MNTYSSIVDSNEWSNILREVEEFDEQKYDELCQESVWGSAWFESKSEKIQKAIKAKPFWYFYTDAKEQRMVYRVYGVVEYEDGSCGYHVCTAHIGWTNDVIGGIQPEELVRVHQWSDDHLAMIRVNDNPKLFLHPAGWMVFADK